MAFSGMGSSGGRGGRGRWRSQLGVLSEMNVVPLVDVVLVLLIIFMVTASVMEFGLNIDVPQVEVKDTAEEHPVVSVARDGTTYLNDKLVNLSNIGEEVRRRFKGQDTVYVRGDKKLTLGDFLQVVSALDQAKLKQMVVTKPEDRAK